MNNFKKQITVAKIKAVQIFTTHEKEIKIAGMIAVVLGMRYLQVRTMRANYKRAFFNGWVLGNLQAIKDRA